MRKAGFIILSIVFIFALIVWFGCNPFQEKTSTEPKFNVFEETSGTRLTISCTLIVNGSTYDLGGAALVQAAGNPLGDGSQQESQAPMATVANGTLKNGSITPPAADGIHFYGGTATITGVNCSDVGEDYVSVKSQGTYTMSSLTCANSEDKMCMINDLCTITYSSVTANNMSKFSRQNGDKTWKATVYINGCTINGFSEAIGRSDSTTTTFFYRNITSSTPSSSWWYTGTKYATY
jgi:pectate lyase C